MEAVIAEAEKKRKLPKPPRQMTLEDYFKAEEKSTTKHEYHDGTIIPIMAGGKLQHNVLAQRLSNLVENHVFDNELDYLVSNSDTKIRIEHFNKIVYPDAVVICGEPNFFEGRQHTITNPIAVIEVLSKSTKTFDSTTKFEMYRSLPSFKEYVLVHQDREKVSVFTKQEEGTWLLRDYEGTEQIAILQHIENCPLPLSRLYRNLKK